MISIVIPVYNVEKYLEECVRSVQRQSISDWEMILVDDGSTDSSGLICDSLASADDRIRVLHGPNQGQGAARNKALDIIRGDLLLFIDSDDVVSPDYIKTLLSIKQSEGVEIASVGFEEFYDKPHFTSSGSDHIHVISGQEAIKIIFYQTSALNTSPCGKLFDAALWTEIRFCEGKIYEDLEALHRVFALARKVSYSDVRLYHYRKQEESTLSKVSARRADVLDVTEGICKEYEKYPADMRAAASDRLLSASFNILGLMEAYPGPLDSQRQRCLNHIRRLKRGSFFNPHVRLKNKVGILIFTLFGQLGYRLLARRLYRK